MPSVYLSSPTNSTMFTTCCRTAICDDQARCPKCKADIYPVGEEYSNHDRHKLRWQKAYGANKMKNNDALDALDRIESNNNVYVRDIAHEDEIEGLFKVVRDYITRPQPSGDAVKALDDFNEWMRLEFSHFDNTQKAQSERNLAYYASVIRAALTQPQLKTTQNCSYEPKADVETAIDEYLEDYALETENRFGSSGSHSPSENEKFLIKDAMLGFLSERDLAAQGYIGVPEGYALVPIEPENRMLIKAGITRKQYGWLLEAAPKKEV